MKAGSFIVSLIAGALLLVGSHSQAATLTGDTVGIALNASAPGNSLVGAGVDLSIGAIDFDLDTGLNGDQLEISVRGSFNSLSSGSGNPLTITFSDLDFSDGEVLTGFDNLFTVFADTTFSFTDNSLTFQMTDGPVSGVVLSGTFVTSAVAVPLPAAAPLLATALIGVFALGRRRRQG